MLIKNEEGLGFIIFPYILSSVWLKHSLTHSSCKEEDRFQADTCIGFCSERITWEDLSEWVNASGVTHTTQRDSQVKTKDLTGESNALNRDS